MPLVEPGRLNVRKALTNISVTRLLVLVLQRTQAGAKAWVRS